MMAFAYKLNHRILYLVLFLLGNFAFPAFAQEKLPALERADKLYDKLAFSKAIEEYLQILKAYPTQKDAIMKLADCYRRLNDSKNAAIYYQRVVNYAAPDPTAYLYYGQALMQNQQYNEALPWFQKFVSAMPADERGLKMIASCKQFGEMAKDSSMYEVKLSKVSSPFSDFSPTFWGKKVVFSSARKISGAKYDYNDQSFLDLYSATYNGSPLLGQVEGLDNRINTPVHEANAVFSAEGDEIYFTRNNVVKGKFGQSKEGVVRLKTFYSKLEDNKWTSPLPLAVNDDEYSVGHPCISPDGTRLYFISDKPGGLGETDLYFMEKQENGWGEPRNLGAPINTPGKEMFPTMDQQGTLYFSSNGHLGLGGLDIYRVEGNPGKVGAVVKNMGKPVNSSFDDFGFIIDNPRGVGFFSSNREGGAGDDDIYGFVKNIPLHGIVTDEVTKEPIPGASVKILSSGKPVIITTDAEGKYVYGLRSGKEYFLTFSAEEYIEQKHKVSTRDQGPQPEVYFPVSLAPLQGPEAASLDPVGIDGQPTTPKNLPQFDELSAELNKTKLLPQYEAVKEVMQYSLNLKPEEAISVKHLEMEQIFFIVYYDYNRSDLGKEATQELDKIHAFMEKHQNVKVEISAHTDCRGKHSYNEELSRLRAKEAYEYLIRKKIPAKRLDYTWYGENMPVNYCIDGVDCQDAAHQLNRRTEFKIIGL